MKCLFFVSVYVLLDITGYTQTINRGGSDIFRISYTNSRSINNVTDVITMGLVSVDLTKTAGLFKEDSQLGVLIRASISGSDLPTKSNQSTTIERLYIVDVRRYPTGKVSLPIEGTIFDNFPLRIETSIYTKVELEIILLRKRRSTDFGFVVKNVAKLTQSLPFPSNPFDPIVKNLTNSINDMLSSDNDKSNNIEERIPTGRISLNFLPTSPFATKTGIFAIIFGEDPPLEPGFIDISRTNDYTFSCKIDNVKRAIYVADKNDPDTEQELKNDNLMFFIEAFATNVEKQKNVSVSFTKADSLYSSTSKEIENVLTNSVWYSSIDKSFNQPFYAALTAFGKNKTGIDLKFSNNDTATLNISTTRLLMSDYINAIEQRRILGMVNPSFQGIFNIAALPQPSEYLLNEARVQQPKKGF